MKDYINQDDTNIDACIERVDHMEELYNECRAAADKFEQALRDFFSVQNKTAELSQYRSSGRLASDIQGRDEGLIPQEKGGNVLSEYGISGLLTDNHELIAEMLEKAAIMVRITP